MLCVFFISKFQVSVFQIFSPTTKKNTLNTISKCLAILAYFAFGKFQNVWEYFSAIRSPLVLVLGSTMNLLRQYLKVTSVSVVQTKTTCKAMYLIEQ